MWVGGQRHAPADLPPRKTRYPFYRTLGGPQGRSGRAENLVPTGIRSRTVQPVVSRYTDWAIRPAYDREVETWKTDTARGQEDWTLNNTNSFSLSARTPQTPEQ